MITFTAPHGARKETKQLPSLLRLSPTAVAPASLAYRDPRGFLCPLDVIIEAAIRGTARRLGSLILLAGYRMPLNIPRAPGGPEEQSGAHYLEE